MRRVLRQPLLHFLALGALLYALTSLREPQAEPIMLHAADVATLRASWRRETGRAPDAAELQASLRRHADEEMLVREALRRGLDERDAVVRERLLRNVEFAFPQQSMRPAQALQLARELGMAQRDVVARRRLVQLVEALLASNPLAEPDQADPTELASSERRAFHQLWFDGGQREVRALATLEALQRGDTQAAQAADAFLLGAHFAPLGERQLAQRFGADFARAVMNASPGAWIGPVESAYGLHLLRVERVEIVPAPRAHPYRVLAEREAQALRQGLARLRVRYPLQVAEVVP